MESRFPFAFLSITRLKIPCFGNTCRKKPERGIFMEKRVVAVFAGILLALFLCELNLYSQHPGRNCGKLPRPRASGP